MPLLVSAGVDDSDVRIRGLTGHGAEKRFGAGFAYRRWGLLRCR